MDKKLSDDPKMVASVARMLRMLKAAGFIEYADGKSRLTADGRKALFIMANIPGSEDVMALRDQLSE